MIATRKRSAQSGAALLMMMLVIIVGSAAVLVTGLNRNAGRLQAKTATQQALVQAKSALLGFAMLYPDSVSGAPVQLPCPDLDGSGTTIDGESHTFNCGIAGVTMMGRLPWRTLGVSAPRDGASECLWYVVSGEYKSAGATTATMINPDSNGQIELYQSETGSIIEGQTSDERPVALIIAPGHSLGSQTRQAISQPGQQCSDDFSAAAFLDADSATSISNASLIGVVGLDQFVRSAGEVEDLNDRILPISRREMADLVYRRHDFDARIRMLTDLVAQCVASYGLSNPGGPNDRRLPWPAPVTLTDYRVDAEYDDVTSGTLSGRFADTVDDSSALTGNGVGQILAGCDPVAVPGWNAESMGLWQQWKDHFFYYVADSFSPPASVPSNCTDCITVNSSGQYAGVVLFANRRLSTLGQQRNAPPIDTDTKDDISNYLEEANSIAHPYTGGSVDLTSRSADSSFNDVLYCIDATLSVMAC